VTLIDYKFIKTFEFNFNFGTLISVDFGSQLDNDKFFNSTEEVFKEIKDCVINRGIPELIWFKGIGDSIRHANSKQIINLIKKEYPNQRVGIYLNCALFEDEDIRKDFYDCDVVAINLNSVEPYNFSKINRCPEYVNSVDVLKGIEEFRKEFKGELGIYTMFLSGVNDNMRNVEELKDFLLKVLPDHYSVSNYTLNGFKPVSEKFKQDLEKELRYLPFKVIYTF
jgi:wyosine [tRNA(Phe)-imidazoG37] synthetase (radical SAM superfamily)